MNGKRGGLRWKNGRVKGGKRGMVIGRKIRGGLWGRKGMVKGGEKKGGL